MLVNIATFSFPHEARLAKAQLDAFGIPAFLVDEHTINGLWIWSNAIGGVRLQVPAELVEQAQSVLAEPTEMEPIPDAEFDPDLAVGNCPFCGGSRGEAYIEGKRPAIFTWMFLGFPVWPIKKLRQCSACGKTSKA
jgi:hypothetical protein